MSDQARIRKLKINSGVVKRVTREKCVYKQEAQQQRDRVNKLKEQEAEEHLLRKQEEVLQEALMMIPDAHRRLVKAHAELKGILETESDLKETSEYTAAVEILKAAEKELAENDD